MCCQSKIHAVRALIAAVVLHVLCILLGIACCAVPFVTITTPGQYCGRYCGYTGEVVAPVGTAALPLSLAVPALAFLALGVLLSVLASVFICLRACRLQRSLLGGSSESKGCHTRAYTTLVLSALATLCYIIGCSIIWGAALTLAKLAEERGAKLAAGPGYSCASLAITVSIATSVLAGVSHCCCKVKASPATSSMQPAPAASSSGLASMDKVVPPPGYVIAFLPAPAAGQAPPLPQLLPTAPPTPTVGALPTGGGGRGLGGPQPATSA